MAAQQRVDPAGIVGDPVRVPPPHGREPRVEATGRLPESPDPHVPGQPPGEPLQQLLMVLGPDLPRQIDMRDLSPGMHPGIGTPRHGQLVRLPRPRHGPQRVLDLPLYGPPPPGLLGPPGELTPVVRQIKPNTNEPGSCFITHAQILSATKKRARPSKRNGPANALKGRGELRDRPRRRRGRKRTAPGRTLTRPSTPRREPRRPRRTWPQRPRPS